MQIESGNLKIRHAAAGDAQILSDWWNDGAVMAHAGFPNGIGTSPEEVVQLLDKDDDSDRRWIIELEGRPIGEMNYRTPEEKIAEIGIKLCEAGQQDRGYGTEALKLLMAHIFKTLGYEKIILDTNLRNERAQHVYEKLGFRKVKAHIDSWTNQAGELQSKVDFELSRDEYLTLYV